MYDPELEILLRVIRLLLEEGEPVPTDIIARLETRGIIIEEIANG